MELIHVIVAGSAVLMASIGAYGVASSRNLVRQLLSVEVMFNAVILLLLVMLSSQPSLATLLTIVLISVVTGEIVVVVALLISMYRATRSLTSEPLQEAMV
ncbi:MAG: NADH-quinone oxidoreductase subunit K [Acidilobaceae archaeon]|nr:NADH-quinone oxidoreductase subunit K [Acidilobaceae archaeon]MCX8165793.1 NADH-quinone oxidoreductase subunit K [Acidilobaceae archaeon]MDW7974218.1 NADH-quinone oxidoreductase subunit K [Sulfolobales archaeon]